MSEFNSLLGKLSGRVGEVVFFQRGNKTFIKKRPKPRRTPYTEKEKLYHNKFGFVCKLAGKIGRINEIKFFWKPERWNGRSSCNKIFKENYKRITGEKLEGGILLVPPFGFNLEEYSGKVNKDGLQIECVPIKYTEEIYGAGQKFVIAAGIVVLKSPRRKQLPGYDIISFRSENIVADLKKAISFKISFDESDLKLFKSYKEKKVYFTLITLDKEGTPLKYSSTMIL